MITPPPSSDDPRSAASPSAVSCPAAPSLPAPSAPLPPLHAAFPPPSPPIAFATLDETFSPLASLEDADAEICFAPPTFLSLPSAPLPPASSASSPPRFVPLFDPQDAWVDLEMDEWLAQAEPVSRDLSPDLLEDAGISDRARWLYRAFDPFWLFSVSGIVLFIGLCALDAWYQPPPFSLALTGVGGVSVAPAWQGGPWAKLRPRYDELAKESLPPPFQALFPRFKRKGMPQPDEWLGLHEESGQSFFEYQKNPVTRPDDSRQILYFQPIGPMTASQTSLFQATASFVGAFFCLKTSLRPPLPLTHLPHWAQRRSFDRRPQWHTEYLLFNLLKPQLPKDAFALIGMVATDLWPGKDWRYVFGQASLTDRVGVWSMARFGEPDKSPDARQLALSRTLKTAVHEVGHILSIPHCTTFSCIMNGSNDLKEADAHPLAACPICMRKISWNTSCDPQTRLQNLANLANSYRLSHASAHFQSLLPLFPKK